jgi:hypothetical protein
MKTDGMRRPVSDGMLYALKVWTRSRRKEIKEIKETGNEEDSTATTEKVEKVVSQKLTIGLDLGERCELVLRSG